MRGFQVYFSLDLVTRRSLQWPKLLGSFLGLEALGIFMCQARLLFWHSYNSGWPDAGTTWFWLILATLLSVLAYCLYRAHNWARLTVIIFGICLCALFIWELIAGEMSWAEMLRSEKTGWELWRLQIMSAVESVGSKLSLFLAPVALIIGVLCHRDVAAAFRPSGNERSNQSLERTAGRSVELP
jgi:cell division protein FtsW (lipid II flippase)